MNCRLYTCFSLLLFLHYPRTTYVFIISHNLDYVQCKVPWVGKFDCDKVNHNNLYIKKLPMVSTSNLRFHTICKLHTLTCMLHFVYIPCYIPFHACDILFMACYIPLHACDIPCITCYILLMPLNIQNTFRLQKEH